VGEELCRLLVEAGASVVLADVDAARALVVAQRVGARAVNPQDIHRVGADVFAPCALGASLNAETISDVAAPVVCGAANNQLADPGVGQALHRRGKLYCPDYVVNAGGIIAVHGETIGQSVGQVATSVGDIPSRLIEIIKDAERLGHPPEFVADSLARERIGRGKTTSGSYPTIAHAPGQAPR
jgi:leucine dehydrogenase